MPENELQQSAAAQSPPGTGVAPAMAQAGEEAEHIAKTRIKMAKREQSLLARIAELENANKTQEQKAIEDAYNRGVNETSAKYTAQIQESEIRSAITLRLLESGVPADQVYVVLAKHADLETVDDAKAAAESYAKEWTASYGKHPAPKTPGGSPSVGMGSDPYGPPFTREKVASIITARSAGLISAQKWAELKPQMDRAIANGLA